MARDVVDFLGEWRLDRVICQGDGSEARLTGQAVWTGDASGALCVESGTLQMGAQSFAAERRYRWDPGPRIFFDDGRFFHIVPPDGGTAEHWCDPDHYSAAYDFSHWPDWSCQWRVTGPRKDYTMMSRFRRVSD